MLAFSIPIASNAREERNAREEAAANFAHLLHQVANEPKAQGNHAVGQEVGEPNRRTWCSS